MSDFSRYDIRVAYHETDAMAVVHHSNHIKYFEEARIDFLRKHDIHWHDHPEGEVVFAVYQLETRYLKPARFDEELQIWSQARVIGARVNFHYAIFSKKQNSFVALGSTELVALDENFKPRKLPRDIVAKLKVLPWNENWPPALN